MIGIIIQARTGSSRLPKKVIKKIEGKTVLEHVILRTKIVENCDKVILATTDKKEDDILEKIGKECQISVFRGSENDVLDRFYQTAKLFKINHIVRITADCPLIDPKIVKEVIKFYFKNNFDYVGNAHPPTFPDGMDVEVFSFNALEKSWKEALSEEDRGECVTPYILKNIKIFKIGNFFSKKDLYDLRLTLDEKDDLILIKEIYKELYRKDPKFGLNEILKLFLKRPELLKINHKITSRPISRWKRGQTKL